MNFSPLKFCCFSVKYLYFTSGILFMFRQPSNVKVPVDSKDHFLKSLSVCVAFLSPVLPWIVSDNNLCAHTHQFLCCLCVYLCACVYDHVDFRACQNQGKRDSIWFLKHFFSVTNIGFPELLVNKKEFLLTYWPVLSVLSLTLISLFNIW